MSKKRSNPASRRARNIPVRRIKLFNSTAIVTQADEYGRVCLLAEQQAAPGPNIRTNSSMIREHTKFLPPFLTAFAADQRMRNAEPRIEDPTSPTY